MKKSSLLLISIALMWLAAPVAQVNALAASPFSQEISQDEQLRAPDAGKGTDNAAIKFEGLKNVSELDVRRVLRERRANVTKEEINDPVKLQQAKIVIKEYLATRGYLSAIVTTRQDRTPGTKKTITFVINEGERARIAEIQFEGNNVFPDQQLLDSMKATRDDSKDLCAMQEGYDSSLFEYCLRRVESYMRSKGYLKAKLGEPKKQETEHGLKFIVPVTEEELYRLGEIKIEGATVFTGEQILSMLKLKTGDAANGEAIGEWLQSKLKNAYAELGYIQYEYDVEPTFSNHPENVNEGTIELRISITEGNRFIIRKINFLGTTRLPDDELRRLLLLHEGEAFNQNKLVESVRNLYRLGLSGGDAERDVDYRTDEEEGFLDIAFILKGYKRPPQIDNSSPAVTLRAPSPN